jgi:hypothetical protein
VVEMLRQAQYDKIVAQSGHLVIRQRAGLRAF